LHEHRFFRFSIKWLVVTVILTADLVTQADSQVASRYELRKLNLVGYFSFSIRRIQPRQAMDLIYFILSVFLRLLPAVRKHSVRTGFASLRGENRMELAVWIPLVGWVSVSVQHFPEARWLPWRVRNIRSFGQSSLNHEQKQGRRVGSKRRGRSLPPRFELPD